MSGYNQANPLITLRSLGIPVLWRWEKHAFAGIVRNRSFSICLEAMRASFPEALRMSLYVISDEDFFCEAPDTLIQILGRRE